MCAKGGGGHWIRKAYAQRGGGGTRYEKLVRKGGRGVLDTKSLCAKGEEGYWIRKAYAQRGEGGSGYEKFVHKGEGGFWIGKACAQRGGGRGVLDTTSLCANLTLKASSSSL